MRPLGQVLTALAAGTVAAGTYAIVSAYIQSKEVNNKIVDSLVNPPPYIYHGSHLVSVIVPALQEEEYLPKLLQSVNSQTYAEIEKIVADSSTGESKSKTQQICQQFGALYVNVPKLNVALARNEGAARATGDILCFVDADCVLSSDYIERMVEALKTHTLAHGADPYYGDKALMAYSLIGRGYLKPKTWTTGRGVCIWKDAFDELGGYDVGLDPTIDQQREDLDLGRRVSECFGSDSIALLRNVYVGESTRRIKCWPFASWDKVRGVRNRRIIYKESDNEQV